MKGGVTMLDKKIANILILILSILVINLSGCATDFKGAPGHITETISEFDNSKQIVIEPALMPNGQIWLGLYKNTKMKGSSVVMTAVVRGAHNFVQGDSLHFNIDGQIVSFSSIDDFTDIELDPGFVGHGVYIKSENWSSKRYLVAEEFIKQLIDANKVYVKIDLAKSFVEDKFSSDCAYCARPAFIKFYGLLSYYYH